MPAPLGVSRFSGFFRGCPALRALPKGPARSSETPLRPVPGPPARTALPQRPQGNRLPSAHGPESRSRPPLGPAGAAGRTDRHGGHPPRISPLAGPLSLSPVGRVGRTGQERSSRCLVRLGGVRPAVCPGNPLPTAGLPRIGPGRRRLRPASPSRPSPGGIAAPPVGSPARGSLSARIPHPWPRPGNRIHGHLAAEPCRAVVVPMARHGQGAACGLTRRPR